MNLKNRIMACCLLVFVTGICQSQTKYKPKTKFKYSLRYYFDSNMIKHNNYAFWIPTHEINTDSTYKSSDEKSKLTGYFKILDSKGACEFTLIDSLNNNKITGQFMNGLDLLSEQEAAFTPDGETLMMVTHHYKGIANGDWLYYDFKGTLLKKIKYKDGFVVLK
jgi:antitoxin component YwqK of YwqJK toxin-antitoxin module